MLRKIFIMVAMILCLSWLNNCSVFMLKDVRERSTKLSQDHVEWTQEELEKYYGDPIATTLHDDGSKTCIYEFKSMDGTNTETGENFFLVMDALTLGIGEIFFVPIVQYAKIRGKMDAPTMRVWVTYDSECKAKIENRVRKSESD